MQPAYKPAVLYLGYYELAYIAIVFAIKFHIMKNEIWVEGQGLEALYNYLQQQERDFTVDCQYKFNHWFLYADIVKVQLTGDVGRILGVLKDYYGGRSNKDVTITVEDTLFSLKDKTIQQIIEAISVLK